MASFLSDEWLAELAEALRRSAELAAGPALRLGQIVTDAPTLENAAEVRYTIHLGGGAPAAVTPGSVDEADVVLVEDYETARAIATGTPPASLLAAGRIKVRGDAGALIAAQEQLAGLGEALSGVALGTHFAENREEPAAGGGALERAMLRIVPGRVEEFLDAFPAGASVLTSAPGCRSVRLLQGIEDPTTFLLLVEWHTLEDHTVVFRESPLFTEWRSIVGPYFAEAPVVEHFRDV